MLVCLSAHHRSAPFESLESLSRLGESAAPALRAAHEDILGTVVLATCNRFEAYFDIADESPVPSMDAAMERLAAMSDLPFRTVRESVDFAHGSGVARHLFSVAAGLESVVVGEDEIAGQVKRALDAARKQGLTTTPLESLFQRAAETSRVVKNAVGVGAAGRSLVRVALQMASSRVVDWAQTRVLLIGTGRYAATTLSVLRSHGAVDIGVFSASGRGAEFAARQGLALVTERDFAAAAARAQVVIACTSASDAPVLPAPVLRAARGGDAHAQLVIDLGMPRNVDPAVAELPGTELLDLDTIRLHAPLDEFAALGEAREIVAEAARRHAAERRVREVSPSVVALRGYLHGLLEEEIARLRGRGDGVAETERALRHFEGVVLHRLIGQGHTLAAAGAGQEWCQALELVFPLDTQRPSD
ncbi:glutamyl-tRNA reductase [Microbacterium sp.]|uniref:glutamyl-tRNA reductase n=1 Tax=Microbacterium sp. TaxID=51671 RepID=UPI0039E6ED91